MPQSHMYFDPQLSVSEPPCTEPPRCPKCNYPTLLTGIKSGRSGLYLRIFECPACGYTEKIVAKSNDAEMICAA
jgi:hypothetical protein